MGTMKIYALLWLARLRPIGIGAINFVIFSPDEDWVELGSQVWHNNIWHQSPAAIV
jgi:hypothetical protein